MLSCALQLSAKCAFSMGEYKNIVNQPYDCVTKENEEIELQYVNKKYVGDESSTQATM